MEIQTVTVYRVKGDRKTFRTYKALVNRLAWLLVFDKYGDDISEDDYGHATVSPKNDPVFCDPCDCNTKKYLPYGIDGNDATAPPYTYCPVHDREDGYLRRLHDRLARFILANYPMPEFATIHPKQGAGDLQE